MSVSAPEGFLVATLALAAAAAVFDLRTQRIPNALTFGAILLAFPLHVWLSPPVTGLESAALGAFACALPAVIGWRLEWVAGGDVKLIAAMGAVGGVSFGLESVFLALFCATSFIVLRLAWQGRILRTVGNAVSVTASRTVLRKMSVSPAAEFVAPLKFGPFALLGALLSLLIHGATA